jgi:hypothetical protein
LNEAEAGRRIFHSLTPADFLFWVCIKDNIYIPLLQNKYSRKRNGIDGAVAFFDENT